MRPSASPCPPPRSATTERERVRGVNICTGAMVHLLSINSSLERVGALGRHGWSQACNFFANSRIKPFLYLYVSLLCSIGGGEMSTKMTWIPPVLAVLQGA
jgi:hypothetical protein